MDHMTEAQIIDQLQGEGPKDGELHLAECARCRSVKQLWTERLRALREMTCEPLDESELHHLMVLYRQLGPKPSRTPRWIATFVGSSRTAPVSARGIASGEIMEYSAGPLSLMLRIGARGSRTTVSVAGQLESDVGDREIGGTFSLTSPVSAVRFSDVDQFGEFHIPDVAPGRYEGTWWFEDQILVVPDVEIGIDDEPRD